jgi:subtilisin family serine protease
MESQKGVLLHSVRVMKNTGTGTYSSIFSGIDYLISVKKTDPSRKMVANLSIGGGKYDLLDNAVNNAVKQGIVMVVAAGNSVGDACTMSPAATTGAITVGATTNTDARAYYSNFGRCVDIFAPGSDIKSLTEKIGVPASYTGTSMAAPHVTGVVALYLQAGRTAQQVITDASTGLISDVGLGSPNRFLYIKISAITTTATKTTTIATTATAVKTTSTTKTLTTTNAATSNSAPAATTASTSATMKQDEPANIFATKAVPVPTKIPTKAPTKTPTRAPTIIPTKTPTKAPTIAPTIAPTQRPITLAPPVSPLMSNITDTLFVTDNTIISANAMTTEPSP